MSDNAPAIVVIIATLIITYQACRIVWLKRRIGHLIDGNRILNRKEYDNGIIKNARSLFYHNIRDALAGLCEIDDVEDILVKHNRDEDEDED